MSKLIREVVEKFFEKHPDQNFADGFEFYEPDEWEAMGQSMGRGARLHALFEGSSFYHLQNLFFESSKATALYNEWCEWMAQHKILGELGHAWSKHFYYV